MTFSEKLTQLRKERKLPAFVLAKRARVSHHTLWLAEKWGIAPARRETRQRIADALGVSYEALWGDCDSQGGECQP